MISIGELRGLLTLDDQLTPELEIALSKLDKSAQQVSNIGSKLAQAGAVLTAAITLPLLAAGNAALSAGVEFQTALNQINGVLRATDAEMERVRATALKLGADTVFSATDAATAVLELGKAGFEVNEALSATDEVLQLAAASGLGMGEAAELSARALRGFKLEVGDLQHVNDVLAKAVNTSTLEIRDLQLAFQYVAPIATGFGVSIEETSAALAIMRDNGIAAETTGRALREAFGRLANPVKAVEEVVGELGLSLQDVNPELHSLDEIVATLEGKGLTAAQSLKLFGDAAGPGMYALVSQGSEALRELTTELENSDGAAKDMADAMMEGLPGAMERMRGSVETAWIAISDAIEPTVIRILDGIASLADIVTNYLVPAFKAIPEPVQMILLGLTGVAALIGPLIGTIGVFSMGLGSLVSAFTAVRASTMAMQVATAAWGASVTVLGPALAVVATGLASWKLGTWIGEVTGATDAVGKFAAKVGEFIGLLPEGTAKQYDAMRAAEAAAAGHTKAAAAVEKHTKAAVEWQGPMQQAADKTQVFLGALREQDAAANKLDASQKNAIATAIKLGASTNEIAEAMGISEYAVKKYADALDAADKKQKAADESAKKFAASVKNGLSQAWVPFVAGVKDAGVGLQNIAAGFDESGNLISQTLNETAAETAKNDAETKKWAMTTGGMLAPAVKDVNAALEEGAKAGKKWTDFGKNLSQTILRAFQGGGDVGKSIGSQLGGDIGNWAGEKAADFISKNVGGKLGSALGGIAGGFLGPLGAMAGGWLGGKIGKLFGGGEGKQVNDLRDKFVSAAGGIEALNSKAVAAGMTLDELLRADKVSEFEAAVQRLNMGFEQQTMDLQLAKQAAEEFGIPMERMGQAFKQAETDAEGGGLLEKIKALTSAGVDLQTIVEFAGDDLGAFIQRAIEMGTTVPREFEMIAKKMIEQGTLIDANGDAFTELGQIPFAADLNAQFSELMVTLNRFIDAISNVPAVEIPIRYVPEGGMPEAPVPMASGGIITRPTNIIAGEAGAEAIVPLNRLGDLSIGSGRSEMLGGKLDELNQNFRNFAATQPRTIATAVRDARNGAV